MLIATRLASGNVCTVAGECQVHAEEWVSALGIRTMEMNSETLLDHADRICRDLLKKYPPNQQLAAARANLAAQPLARKYRDAAEHATQMLQLFPYRGSVF